jgi:hypothetical protein
VLRPGRLPFLLTTALAVAATVGAAVSLFRPDLLSGAPVMRGNLRGTAVVVFVLAVPLLLAAAVRTRRGSTRWLVTWLGVAAYLTYQGVLFCFATPFNALFLVYVAHLGLGIWTLLALAWRTDLAAFGDQVDPRLSGRLPGGLLMTIGVLNGAAWLARVIPTVGSARPSSVLAA